MPVRYGEAGTWNQEVGIRQDIDEAITILTPTDVPLQQWLGTPRSTSSIKVEWLEEDLTPQAVTIAGGGVSGTGPWTLTVDDVNVLRPGDVLWKRNAAANVQYTVTSIDTGANTTVVAAFAGNAVAPVAADVLDIVGQYRNEGADPEEMRSVDRLAAYNYTQWGQEKIEATRTARKQDRFANSDPYDHELMKKFKELAIRYERSLLVGQRTQSGDKKKRFMGGLFYFITSNTVSDTKANAATAINLLLRQAYDLGGTPSVLMVSPSMKAALSANIDPDLRQSTRSETVGGWVIDSFLSDFGTVDFTVNRHMPKTKGLLLQREYLQRVNFDGYFHEVLAKTGDADQGHVVGEFTVEVKNEKAHGVLTLTDA